MKSKTSIYLLGFRGAGKSTLLKNLHGSLHCESVDLDAEIEKGIGEPILNYVEHFGLEAFRRVECARLAIVDSAFRESGKGPAAIATGGGIVDWSGSREILAQSPHARVFLRTPPELLWERLQDSPERRKIRNLDSFQALCDLLAERTVHYEILATHVLENGDLAVTQAKLEGLCRHLWQ